MQKKMVIIPLFILLMSSAALAQLFRGYTGRIDYQEETKALVTDDVVKVIMENPKRFPYLYDSAADKYIKTAYLTKEEIRKLLMERKNIDKLRAASSVFKYKQKFGSKVERVIPGKMYEIPGDIVRYKSGYGVTTLTEDVLTDQQLDKIMMKCNANKKGIFYDLVTKKNRKFEYHSREQLKKLVKIGPRQHKCVRDAVK